MQVIAGIDNALYVIIDKELLVGKGLTAVVSAILNAGVKWIQYRDKRSPDEEVTEALKGIIPLCRSAGAKLIVNDRVRLVSGCGADGVHLGQGDMPVTEARRILGREKIIGCSVRSVKGAKRAEADGADYLGVGAVYTTSTKLDAVVVGVSCLGEISRCVRLPVIGIGGINQANVRDVLRTGASGVAVASAILSADEPGEATRKLLEKIEAFKKKSVCKGIVTTETLNTQNEIGKFRAFSAFSGYRSQNRAAWS